MLNTPDSSPRPRGKKSEANNKASSKGGGGGGGGSMMGGSASDVNSDAGSICGGSSSNSSCPSPCKDKAALIGTKSGGLGHGGGGGFMTLGHKAKLKQIWGKVNPMARGRQG